ncbi:MAG: glycosyltransferase family 2 protein [Ginsengibacter sp.]
MLHKIVSIIVPCYNYGKFLSEALDSVFEQTYADWECVIVNDGSTDNTEEIALRYCDKDERFSYLYKENGGHSSARNFAIKSSSGKYILPLDADDRLSKDYLKKAVKKIESSDDIKLVTGQVQQFGDVNEKMVIPAYDLRSYLIVNYLPISSLFRRTDFDKTNGFDESMLAFEDWNLFIGILKNGGRVVELPEVGLFYRKKDQSIFRRAVKDRHRIFKDLLKLYNNHAELYEKYFDNPIHLLQENEKLERVIGAYRKSKTYRLGLKVDKIKKIFKG